MCIQNYIGIGLICGLLLIILIGSAIPLYRSAYKDLFQSHIKTTVFIIILHIIMIGMSVGIAKGIMYLIDYQC